MITVGKLKSLLETLPDDYRVWAYEGEDVGIGIESPDGKKDYWIRATSDERVDSKTSGWE